MIEKAVYLLACLVAAIVLLSITSKLFPHPQKTELKGSKLEVLRDLAKIIQQCYSKCSKNVVCKHLKINSEKITAEEILNSLDYSKLGAEVRVEGLSEKCEIVIRCENGILYVEKVKYERISS